MSGVFANAAAREDCRRGLDRLLTEELAALAELERLLEAEREVLVRNESPEALEDACARRQDCMGGLLRVQDERRSLVRALGFEADAAGLERLLRECDPQRSLPARDGPARADHRSPLGDPGLRTPRPAGLAQRRAAARHRGLIREDD